MTTTTEILNQLIKQKDSVFNLKTKNKAGVYAIFHKNIKDLVDDNSNGNGIVYIGKSSNLAQREFETHFNSGASGFSTLRRTIGAMLKEEFKLNAIPRSSGSSDTNWRNYKFTSEGEDKITKWMKENLQIAVYETDDIDYVETELIQAAKPIFNLTGWDNPYAKTIKAKRKICAEEARKQIRK
jgi:hypothetical protein